MMHPPGDPDHDSFTRGKANVPEALLEQFPRWRIRWLSCRNFASAKYPVPSDGSGPWGTGSRA